MISRRNFLLGSVFAGGLQPSRNLYATQEAFKLVKLGNTGLRVTPVGFGSSSSADPKLVKKEKKRSPKKRTEKKAVGNADTKDKEDNDEDSKQKRKGWWSLKG